MIDRSCNARADETCTEEDRARRTPWGEERKGAAIDAAHLQSITRGSQGRRRQHGEEDEYW